MAAVGARGERGEGRRANGEMGDGQKGGNGSKDDPHARPSPLSPLSSSVQHLAHYYMRGTPLAVKAIKDVSLDVHRGEIVGILGHTGSGKSTAIQHFNGLMRPHEGQVTVLGSGHGDPKTDMRAIRRRVGLVFQQPEAQLFEQYVGDDVAFGPRKLGLGREEVRERVKHAMEAVGLDFAAFKDRQTFGLSGGQMRRVALAGVLALEPEVLVLDEPTAGLDPQARRNLLAHIRGLRATGHHAGHHLAQHGGTGRTVRLPVCDRRRPHGDGGTPAEIFGQADRLRSLGSGRTQMLRL